MSDTQQTINALQAQLAVLDGRAAPLRRQLNAIEDEMGPARVRLAALLQEDRELASREASLREQLAAVENQRRRINPPATLANTILTLANTYPDTPLPVPTYKPARTMLLGAESADRVTDVLNDERDEARQTALEALQTRPEVEAVQTPPEEPQTPPEVIQGPPRPRVGERTRRLVRDGIQPPLADAIMDQVNKNPEPMSVAEVCNAVEATGYISEARKLEDSITPVLAQLVSQGRLHRPAHGKYAATNAEVATQTARQRAAAASVENGVPVEN